MFAYIAMASHAMSLVLVRVDSGVQRPVYYVSKSLHEVEVRYLPLGKAILAVVHATRKLPHYFQLHTVVVLSSNSSLYSEVLIIQGGLPSGVRS